MVRSSFHVLLLSALVAQGQCLMFGMMHDRSGSQVDLAFDDSSASSNFTGSNLTPPEANDQKYLAFLEAGARQLPPAGTAVCQHLEPDEKDNTQVPYKFRTVERLGQFACDEDEPLFEETHSLFDWRCAHRCLATPECKYMQVFFVLKSNGDWQSTLCQAYSQCSKLVEYPDYTEGVNISIYERNPELAGQRNQVPFLDSFRVRARQRLLLYIDFNQPVESFDDDAVRRLARGETQGGDNDDEDDDDDDAVRSAGHTQAVMTEVLQGNDVTTDICFKSSFPNTAYDGRSLEIDTRDSTGHKWALVKFAIPRTISRVVSAHLEISIFNSGDASLLHEMLVQWDSSSTFSSVGMSGTGIGNTGVWDPTVVAEMPGGSGTQSLDVTSSVQRWQSGESINHGWIWEPTGSDGVDFHSSTGSVPPKLTIAYQTSATTTPASGTTTMSIDISAGTPSTSDTTQAPTRAAPAPTRAAPAPAPTPAGSTAGVVSRVPTPAGSTAGSSDASSSTDEPAADPSPAPTPLDPGHRRRISRRRTAVQDSNGQPKGSLWTSGNVDNRRHDIPKFSDQGKFGGYWSFKNSTTGIRIPQNEDLLDYSVGPAATIVVVYRKDGYDSHMGRIFSGPNIDLYGWTNGMAINMNDVRCLYTDHAIYDNEFHFIFVIITFATGHVEMWRDNVHLGNGTHGKMTNDFESLQNTFPWLIGKRYDYDTERSFDGDADEFSIFSYRFTEEDRQDYIACGGTCYNNCSDKDELVRIRFPTETMATDFVDRCNETCMTCVANTVKSVVSNYTNVGEEYISFAYGANISLANDAFFLTFDLNNTGYANYTLFLEVNVSVAPCTLDEVLARLDPMSNVVYDVHQEIKCTSKPQYTQPTPPTIVLPSPPDEWLPAYEHPRVLITKADLPTIRSRISGSWVAQEAKNTMLDAVELFNLSSPYGQMYKQLMDCNLTYLATLTTVEEFLVNQRNNTEWIAYPDIYTMFMYSGLIALLDEDNETGEDLGAALACHSAFMLDLFQPEASNVLNEDCEPALGLAYDYLYNFMTEAQHAPVRRLISRYTTGRTPYGATLREWQLGANGVGFFDGVVVQSLAIEYEEGYDPMVFLNDVNTQKKYWRWTVFDSGFTHEGWHYFMFSMEGAGPALLAAEMRGQGVVAQTNALKAMTGAFYQMSPWISGDQVKIFSYSDGAGIGSPGRINVFFPIMKRLYPDDPVVDFVYNLQIEHQEDRKLTSDWLLFGLIPNRTDWTTEDVAKKANLSLSRFCPDSGRVIMRSDWTEDGMAVHFSARMDTYGVQKMHADINSLTLLSHRRQWVTDTDLAGTLKFNDEFNDMHSTILIDGLGQSGTSTMKTWPSLPGKILDFQDTGNLSFAVGDATLAYTYYGADYTCGKTSRENCNEDVGWGCVWDPGVWGCVRNWSVGEYAPFNMSTAYGWGRNNNQRANMKTFSYPKFFNGSDRDLESESEKWREQHPVCPITLHGERCWGGLYNPVNFAYRNVVLMRGTVRNPHPYVLVIDDIEAQDQLQHNYTISWQVRPHQDHWSRTTGDVDIKRWEANREQVLKSKSASEAVLVNGIISGVDSGADEFPELVVRLVGNPAEGPVTDEFALVNEDQRQGQSGIISAGYQRLEATRQTTLPKFKTIFYPRKQDDPQLVTSYNSRTDTLTVTIGETVDEFEFGRSLDGRTLTPKISRNGATLFGRDT